MEVGELGLKRRVDISEQQGLPKVIGS
jgi:hypothetical protein